MSYIDEEIEAESEGDLELKHIVEMCAPLVCSSIRENALHNYRRFNSGLLSADAQEWFCCAVYSELQQAKMKDMRNKHRSDSEWQEVDTSTAGIERTNSWNISLTRLLRCFKINMAKFLKRMEHWNWLTQQGHAFEQEIKELQRRTSITVIVQQHYKRIFEELYLLPKDDCQEDEEARSHYQSLYEFGWILFLVLRNELPSFFTENLVNGCQLLVCAIELVYVNALEVSESSVINRNFPGLPKDWVRPDYDSRKLDKFSALTPIMALMPELPEKGVRIMQRAFFNKSLMVLFMDQRLLGNDNIFRELVKDGILEINLSTLNRSYAHHIADISEMDERVILSRNQSLEQSEPNSGTHEISSNLSRLLNKELPRSMPPIIVEALDKKSGYLLTNLKNSLQNMSSQFAIKAKHILNKQEAESRFSLATGLYYKLLHSIITSELQMKPLMKISQLLEQPTFSFNLMACCLDLALYVYDEEADQLKFPFVLDCFPAVDPYDYQKIPELVVRHHNDLLSRQLVKHLHTVEEKCLESLIFRQTSQFWKYCKSRENDGNRWNCLPSYIEVQQKVGFKEKENQPVSKCQGSIICLRKFYSLAQQRLSHLCRALYLMDSYAFIWHLVEYSITLQGGKLIQQRHLDVLLLCAIHLYDRLTKERLNFSDIIQQYRRQNFSKSSVYRQVELSDGRNGDIISYYNEVYVKSVSEYARRLHESGLAMEKDPPTVMKSALGHRVPLQEFATPVVKQMYSNIFVSPPALDSRCLYNSPLKMITESMVTKDPVKDSVSSSSAIAFSPPNESCPKLKRASSEKEIVKMIKRPNILRRRTCHE